MKYIRVEGLVAFVQLTRGQEAKIDACDRDLVAAYSWHSIPSPTGGFYARTTGGLYMHRLITNCPAGQEVDHVNHDTLDNRRGNLRVGSHKENMENGKFALATHCPKGHPYDEENTYIDGRGRRCKKCNAERVAAIYAAQSEEEKAARLKRNNDRYYENYDRDRAKQAEYAEKHREEKREYDRIHRAESTARKRERIANETPEQREIRLAKKRESWRRTKAKKGAL
jgi:HNH endonuclease